ncbi:gliding motility protein GldL [Wenyingzhuangia sp. 2_MG-2023]|uniref:type IX secretion system motor protein PorL/GldL n=1 Tax=Wenyingzhuangia sp. 2_MG-2023 TaxID=3062639 RepID=UPI0026E21173|nr:gliding motility protein GldL [Wenyingzhuangia sp. 2_MG-2023]MDO6737667.1 gliding motility protein GldL [Wenyingzhuangia sp. 2_MG-2023]MDO6802506.1 gliding motility protein GldL [Wenyingzhuangia sp. 1_MG-2023]
MLHSKGFKKFMAMAYGIGGAVVIVGALFKLMHWEGSSEMLVLGLGTEAFIFVISAFEPLPQDELDWSLVYPELAGGSKSMKKEKEKETPEGILTKKIDDMLAAAKLDAGVVNKLTTSMNNLSAAAKQIGDSSGAVADTTKYNKEITSAANHLEKINAMYSTQEESMTKVQKSQMEVLENQSKLVNSVSQKSEELTKQMDALSKNISSLNTVYGGMLSAMGSK